MKVKTNVVQVSDDDRKQMHYSIGQEQKQQKRVQQKLKWQNIHETIVCASKETKSLQDLENRSQPVNHRNSSSRKHSWRSKTWKSDYKSQRGEDFVYSISGSRDRHYLRKHSLTVPGELYHHHHIHHHSHHHHHPSRHHSTMGHQQQQEHKPVETKSADVKIAKSKTPSPISTPSPSGSVAGDEPSGCSSCSSSGLDLEFTRKCTVSADSLLLHPDITAMTRTSGETTSKSVEPFTINRQLLSRRKISSSISSDDIHKHSSLFTTESSETQRTPSKSKTTSQKESSKDESSAGPSTSKATKRKDSVTHIVLSGPGRIARLLRRTYSAGSRDTPSHALFLREKPMRKHHPISMSADSGDERKRTKRHRPALEDMKQRLRFLRRRNTDSLLDSSSVRPTPEEAQKWSQSFQLLMSSKYGSTLFKAFLAREFSAENIEFWLACEDYKMSRQSKLASKSKKIFDNFIAVRSPKEVNLASKVRNDIEESLTNPDKTIFDVAQRKIQSLLESDAYIRFLQSELYKELLIAEKQDDVFQNIDDAGKSSPESTL